MNEYKYLKTRQVNDTLWVEIHNPPVNFITVDMCEELYLLINEVEKDDSIRVFILTGGIEDTYIFHFSIPELVKITGDNKKLMLDKIFRTRLGAALVQYNQTFTMWMMDQFPWYERFMLASFKKMRSFCLNTFPHKPDAPVLSCHRTHEQDHHCRHKRDMQRWRHRDGHLL